MQIRFLQLALMKAYGRRLQMWDNGLKWLFQQEVVPHGREAFRLPDSSEGPAYDLL